MLHVCEFGLRCPDSSQNAQLETALQVLSLVSSGPVMFRVLVFKRSAKRSVSSGLAGLCLSSAWVCVCRSCSSVPGTTPLLPWGSPAVSTSISSSVGKWIVTRVGCRRKIGIEFQSFDLRGFQIPRNPASPTLRDLISLALWDFETLLKSSPTLTCSRTEIKEEWLHHVGGGL